MRMETELDGQMEFQKYNTSVVTQLPIREVHRQSQEMTTFCYPHEINLQQLRDQTQIKQEPIDIPFEDYESFIGNGSNIRTSEDEIYDVNSVEDLDSAGLNFALKTDENNCELHAVHVSDKYLELHDGYSTAMHDGDCPDTFGTSHDLVVKAEDDSTMAAEINASNDKSNENIKVKKKRKRNCKEQKTFFCQICKQKFKYLLKLKAHLEMHSPCNNTCRTCGKIFKTSEVRRIHEKKHDGTKEFVCETCGKEFLGSSAYVTHKRIHTGEKPFKCNICDQRFSDPSNFNRHKKSHKGLRPSLCNICQQRFTRLASLVRHYKNIHNVTIDKDDDDNMIMKPLNSRGIVTDAKDMSGCNSCGRTFANANGLRIHQAIHARIKSHTCKTCGKNFCREDGLKTHMKIHADDRPFVCEVCNSAFTERRFLTRHMKIHSKVKPYQCVTCLKRFLRSSCLRVHERIHSGEKPFECNVCGKRFSVSSNANKHQKSCNETNSSLIGDVTKDLA